MDPQLGLQMQSLGRELNTVLARFHAVSRHAPSLAAAPDGALEAVPCSVIDSWEVQLQKRLDACELDKQAAVQRCNREKEEVVESAKRHIATINATATHLERGLTNQKVTVHALRLALRDADDDLRSQAQQLRMQLEENHALGVELLHARELLGAERASAEQRKWRFEAAQAAAQAAARSQLAAALQLATTAREDSARLRAELVPL
jgi:hypothetical protein